MLLPTQKTPPKRSLQDLTILVYGKQKCGKSEFCAQAESTLFLATEAGLKSLEVYQVPISKWEELSEALAQISEGKHPFKTIAIDTVDNAYRMCSEYICAKHKIVHESDLAYGKGYALVNNEFHRVLTKLSLLPYGLLLVSHAQEVEIEGRTGKYHKAVPTLPETPRKIVLGMADVIVYCDVEAIKQDDGKTSFKRVLRTKPSIYYDAGDRTKRLPEMLDFSFAAFAEGLSVPAQATAPTVSNQVGPQAPDAGTSPGAVATAAAPSASAAAQSSAAAQNKPRPQGAVK